MGELIQLFSLIKGASPEVTLIVGMTFVIGTLLINWRKSNVDAMTSMSKQQTDMVGLLTSQNVKMSADLEEIRTRMSVALDKIEELKSENARLNRHIEALEDLMRRYVTKCVDCPHYNAMVDQLKVMKVELND